jgi:hypothetical protein
VQRLPVAEWVAPAHKKIIREFNCFPPIRVPELTVMRNTAIALTLLIVFSVGAYAQSPPTLRIVTETPGLPSDLYYGDVKVKPLRLRPGTNIAITIDDSDFFVHQH